MKMPETKNILLTAVVVLLVAAIAFQIYFFYALNREVRVQLSGNGNLDKLLAGLSGQGQPDPGGAPGSSATPTPGLTPGAQPQDPAAQAAGLLNGLLNGTATVNGNDLGQLLGNLLDQAINQGAPSPTAPPSAHPAPPPAAPNSAEPPMDIRDEGGKYNIALNVPGADESSLKVTIKDQRVKVSGSMEDTSQTGGKILQRERPSGPFERSFTLPSPVDTKSMQMNYLNGVLNISVDKQA